MEFSLNSYEFSYSCLLFRAYLGTIYLVETDFFVFFFAESIVNKDKVSWNSTMQPMNNTKKCSVTNE